MKALIDALNTLFWNYVLIYGLLAVAVFFTLRLGFLQFRHLGEFFRLRRGEGDAASGITPFQALCTTLASRVGTGNIAGVAVALNLGGPGAIFWMWMVALFGMATAYAESTLAQVYKTRDETGTFRGGPAFYMERGLNARWAGLLFSVCLILSFGLVFNAVQANSIAEAFEGAFGLSRLPVGLVLAALSAMVIFGGIRRVAHVSQWVVPFMALAYVLMALYVMAVNLPAVPAVLASIVQHAFGWGEAAGGAAGSLTAALLNGVKRGLFSNEAGMGSAPNAAASAVTGHPSNQGFVQALGVFIDTLIVCTATAVMILLSGALQPGSELTGIQLTQAALVRHVGPLGGPFVAVAVFFFAFTSIVGNYVYAESSMVFLGLGRRLWLTGLRVAALAMVVWGALQSVATVFDAADASMGLMATVNLLAIVLLSGVVVTLTRDYLQQKRTGQVPRLQAQTLTAVRGHVDRDVWPAAPAPQDPRHG